MEANSSNEKPGNTWKNKLEDVESLPQETLNSKDAAWEKLYARLAEKPRNKKIVWYWFAAASVLTAILVSSIMINKPTTSTAQHNKTPDKKESVTKKDQPVKNISSTITNTETKVQLQKSTVVKKEVRKPATVDTQPAEQFAINDQQNSEDQTSTTPAAIDTSAMATISLPPVQKKLKVVHVNELGEVVEFPADVAHGSDLHLFQLKLAQQEIYNASSIASNNSSGLFYKPKNSPN